MAVNKPPLLNTIYHKINMKTLIMISVIVLTVLFIVNLYYQHKSKRLGKEIKNAHRHRED